MFHLIKVLLPSQLSHFIQGRAFQLNRTLVTSKVMYKHLRASWTEYHHHHHQSRVLEMQIMPYLISCQQILLLRGLLRDLAC